MPDFLSLGRSGFELLLVVLGFGFIIFIHELGHFLAAKWAGIRVLAFAIGFGPAAVSYRRGMGWRRGSSEKEYLAVANAGLAGSKLNSDRVSPTEYRLNWLPLGGYVKMLGQEDLNPNAVSAEKDSYQNTPVWKRMVVISAGVVMNVLLSAFLFIAVFMHGLETEPAVVGTVQPGSPAALVVADNAAAAGVKEAGLQPGDTVLEVNGRVPREFTDLVMASAMTSRSDPVSLLVQRPGLDASLRFQINPQEGRTTKLLEMGVEPARSAKLLSARNDEERAVFAKEMARLGLPGVEPGMTLTRAGDDHLIADAADLAEAMRRSGGAPVPVEFKDDHGKVVTGILTPRPLLQVGYAKMPAGPPTDVQHLLGLTPVLRVVIPDKSSTNPQGLEDGDVFTRLGAVEFPGRSQGITEIRRHKGETITATVLRDVGGATVRKEILPPPKVQDKNGGIIGFYVGDTALTDTLLSLPPALSPTAGGEPGRTPAASIITRPGTQVVEVAGKPVHNFGEIRAALLEATGAAPAGSGATVELGLHLPLPGGDGTQAVERVRWELNAADVTTLRELGWASPIDSGIFEPTMYVLKAEGPLDAIRMGLHKTQRVMMSTYLTFARLYEGTVKVEHLKGPVGIAHMGTRIAERGPTWLLFFMALISVNLAVINFLPLPIVDGGQFLFLVLEQIRGKPVSVEVQNVATVLGLVLIGAVFLIVTFHDIAGLFAG